MPNRNPEAMDTHAATMRMTLAADGFPTSSASDTVAVSNTP